VADLLNVDNSNAGLTMGRKNAIYGLGMYYHFGICSDVNSSEAKDMFVIGAERGDMRSMIMFYCLG
jgi:hypothetical protein